MQKKAGVTNNFSWRDRLVSPSRPILFVLYGVPFGLLQSVRYQNHRWSFDLFGALFGTVFFGFFMSLIGKKSFDRMAQSTGFSEPNKQKAVFKAVRTGELPDDPEILKALPKYVNKRLESKNKNNQSYFILVLFAVAGFGAGLAYKDPLFLVLGFFLLIMNIVSYRAIKLSNERLDKLKTLLYMR